ncbi:MAG: His/Gly/Thr/Pro-type tRNA ligase C-terminal domain-containing protein [Fusobacteria bacterium]|nr:His/Gly/Thr/Pro-type tRNA ligase C-terminal domain-containing protein [Fusobacteriota bacterium]
MFTKKAYTHTESFQFVWENLIDKFYSQIFGFEYSIFLSTKPEKAIGSDEIWGKATAGLKAALDNKGLKYTINEGDGAFYGPKIDFVIKDCIGRTWQCGTIQLDLNLPERFDLYYIGADGEKHRPIMIHRVVYGSIERFIGILIEHYAGLFPLWLAPVQINVSTVSEEQHPYAKEVIAYLESQELRVKADLRNEKLGLKIRESNMSKTPIQIILGKTEMEEKKLTVRRHGSQANTVVSFDEFMASIQEELKTVK